MTAIKRMHICMCNAGSSSILTVQLTIVEMARWCRWWPWRQGNWSDLRVTRLDSNHHCIKACRLEKKNWFNISTARLAHQHCLYDDHDNYDNSTGLLIVIYLYLKRCQLKSSLAFPVFKDRYFDLFFNALLKINH